MAKVFVVEDDENIRELVSYALTGAGFDVTALEDGRRLFDELDKQSCDVLLLDIMLPNEDGLQILKRLRQITKYKKLPVIMLTAKGSELDKVKGLDGGADDYITKPFSVLELISRMNALLRRTGTQDERLLTYKEITIDIQRHTVLADGEQITLTLKEYDLLNYLVRNAGVVLSRNRIIETVWGYEFEGESRTVDMHIKTLRQKLGVFGEHIKTVRGVGYRIGD